MFKRFFYAGASILLILIYIGVRIQQDTIKTLQNTVDICDANKVWPTKEFLCFTVPTGGVICEIDGEELQAHLVTTGNEELFVWVEDPTEDGVAWAALDPPLARKELALWPTFHRSSLFVLKTLNEYAGPPPAEDEGEDVP